MLDSREYRRFPLLARPSFLQSGGTLRAALLALAAGTLLLAAAPPATAKLPEPWTGKVVAFADADTLWVTQGTREIKIRLHWADAPEVSRSQADPGQAGGVAALDFASKRWKGATVNIRPRGLSYERIVADVDCDGTSLGFELVHSGNAWVDARYKPPAAWSLAQQAAKRAKRGLWNAEKYGPPVAPWDWRKQKRGPHVRSR